MKHKSSIMHREKRFLDLYVILVHFIAIFPLSREKGNLREKKSFPIFKSDSLFLHNNEKMFLPCYIASETPPYKFAIKGRAYAF